MKAARFHGKHDAVLVTVEYRLAPEHPDLGNSGWTPTD